MLTETQSLQDAAQGLQRCAYWLSNMADTVELSYRQILRDCPSLGLLSEQMNLLQRSIEENSAYFEKAARIMRNIQSIYEENEQEIIAYLQRER